MDQVINISEIKDRVSSIQGKDIMLDRDLAELYEVETKHLVTSTPSFNSLHSLRSCSIC